jgi:membrane-associated protease RseP (regulator of RpoE activity)
MEISVPTLVPSIITGTTSTVTTFKAPPKNNAAMFDFSLAGPLAGIAASCVALFLGSQLTANADPAFLPSLPVEILRQSSLGGGIIDSILEGILYVPDGAPMDGIMISLHPLAIAGFIGLIGNALALLPIGSE